MTYATGNYKITGESFQIQINRSSLIGLNHRQIVKKNRQSKTKLRQCKTTRQNLGNAGEQDKAKVKI